MESEPTPHPMRDLLTESFCERCGTLYTFETSKTRRRPAGGLARVRVVALGVRRYLLSRDTLEASLAGARRAGERELAEAQMEAFHRLFRYCGGCGRYTCLGCWNGSAGRCLTCTPRPEPTATTLEAAAAGDRTCVSCGSPLAPTARFCHRCGALQA